MALPGYLCYLTQLVFFINLPRAVIGRSATVIVCLDNGPQKIYVECLLGKFISIILSCTEMLIFNADPDQMRRLIRDRGHSVCLDPIFGTPDTDG